MVGPPCFRGGEVCCGVDPGWGGSVEQGDPDRQPGLKCPQLLQPLHSLESGRRQGCDPKERLPTVGIDTQMLPPMGVREVGWIAHGRNGQAREINRPGPVVAHHLDPCRIVTVRGVHRSGGGPDGIASADTVDRTGHSGDGQEGLVTLQIHDDVEALVLAPDNHRRGPVGAAGEIGPSHRDIDAGRFGCPRDFEIISGDDDVVDPGDLTGALNDADDERFPGKQLEGFSGQACRAQARRNHDQDRHDTSYPVATPLSKCVPHQLGLP